MHILIKLHMRYYESAYNYNFEKKDKHVMVVRLKPGIIHTCLL